jgi:hypothetical protein
MTRPYRFPASSGRCLWPSRSLCRLSAQTICQVVLLAAACAVAPAQVPPYKTTSLEIASEPDLDPAWKFIDAQLKESFSGTMGLLEIENVGPYPVVDAQFYAKYSTASGQLCFTLVFSQAWNLEHQRGPVPPGGKRTLYASAYYIGPALEPAQVRLYLPTEGKRTGSILHAPPTLLSTGLSGKPWAGLRLERELRQSRGPFLDTLLAQVSVDSEGDARTNDILWALDAGIRGWFSRLLPNLRFRPATTAGTAETTDVLLLLRAVVSGTCVDRKPFPSWDSSAVKNYLATVDQPEVPPLITLLLERAPGNQACKDCFEVVDIGAGWGPIGGGNEETESTETHFPQGPMLRRVEPVSPPGPCE